MKFSLIAAVLLVVLVSAESRALKGTWSDKINEYITKAKSTSLTDGMHITYPVWTEGKQGVFDFWVKPHTTTTTTTTTHPTWKLWEVNYVPHTKPESYINLVSKGTWNAESFFTKHDTTSLGTSWAEKETKFNEAFADLNTKLGDIASWIKLNKP